MRIQDKDFRYGQLVKAYNRETKQEYMDWRIGYFYTPGLIHTFHVDEFPDPLINSFDMVVIYVNYPEEHYQPYLKTSAVEDIKFEENKMVVLTMNSVYEFELGDFDLTEEDKELLMINRVFK